jgi:3-hydroxybutyryl-CoA dehydrogenase
MDIKRVGIVGCGVMGSGIAQLCSQTGYDVLVSDINDELLNKGLLSLDRSLTKRIEKRKLSQQDKDTILSHIHGTTNIKDFHRCDVMIEAVFENLDVKRKIFAELDAVCPQHAILATNTGSLSVIDMAKATKRMDKVLGLHFFNPPHVMKLVELVKTIATSNETAEIGREFAVSLGKTVVIAPDVPGFLANRLMAPLGLNAIRMLEAGLATKEDIDTAAKLGANMPMGPLERADLIGLDIILQGNEAMYQEYKDHMYAPPILLKRMVAAGWLGRKTGKGFYEYDKETES